MVGAELDGVGVVGVLGVEDDPPPPPQAPKMKAETTTPKRFFILSHPFIEQADETHRHQRSVVRVA
jgi:hypothetical protein